MTVQLNNLQNALVLFDAESCLNCGKVGKSRGSDDFRVQASRRFMGETPSPIEWWTQNNITALASDVLMFKICISQRGLVKSIKVVLRFVMHSLINLFDNDESIFRSICGIITWLSMFTFVRFHTFLSKISRPFISYNLAYRTMQKLIWQWVSEAISFNTVVDEKL